MPKEKKRKEKITKEKENDKRKIDQKKRKWKEKKNAKKKYFHDAGMVTLKEHQTYMNDDAYIFNMNLQ